MAYGVMCGDFAELLKIVLICFCLRECSTGVVSRNVQEEDVLKVGEKSLSPKTDHEVESSLILASDSNLEIARLHLSSKIWEVVSPPIPPDFSPEMKLNGDDSITIPTSNENVSVSTRSELSIDEFQDESATDSISDIGVVGYNSSFENVFNEADRLIQHERPVRNISKTEVENLRINLKESNSNTLSLPTNKTESNRMELLEDVIVETNRNSDLSGHDYNIQLDISDKLEDLTSVNTKEKNSSNFDFELFKNSVAGKTVAKAAEVFNLTDSSLTHHIIEDDELHDVLDFMIPSSDDTRNLNSTSEQLSEPSTHKNFNSYERVEDNNTTLLDENNTLSITNLMEIKTDPNLFFNVTDFENVNETVDFTDYTEETTEPSNFNVSVIVKGTDLIEGILTDTDANNPNDIAPKCPPRGICLFWFLSQDACDVNDHCLGSQICCKINCSKTCVDIL